MARLDVNKLLVEAGFEKDRIAEDHFGKPTPLPYVVYVYGKMSPFCADDAICKKFQDIVIELYTDRFRSQKLIDSICEALESTGIIYDTAEDYIDAEKIYRVSFYFQEMI